MMNWRVGVRFAHITGLILFGMLAVSLVFPALEWRGRRRGKIIQAQLRQWWFKKIAAALGLGIESMDCWSNKPNLLVANHVSWLDIIAIGATTRCVFLAKDDVADWPIIGGLARRAGTQFIERDNRRSASQSLQRLASIVDDGLSVCVFPEGTSTDGSQVLRFHSMLFSIATQKEVDVQPVAIAYFDGDGEPSSVAPFIDDDGFFEHLMRVLRQPNIDVQLDFLPTLSSAGMSRKELAECSQQAIAQVLTDPDLPQQPYRTAA